MRQAYFRTAERRAALIAAAQGWLGTPFVGGQAIKGGGVDCCRLADAVCAEAGWPALVDWPAYVVSLGPMARDSRLLTYFRESGHFDLIEGPRYQTGDILLFSMFGGDPYHTGLITRSPQFIHVMRHLRVTIGQADDPVFARVLHSAWRPMEEVA